MQTYQSCFHQEFFQLRDKHVRALAWLLLSPNVLDEASSIWNRQLTHLQLPERSSLKRWLFDLDAHPTLLHESLHLHDALRLGHYAENLLAFYFQHEGILFGKGIQVFDRANHTIGEFDYLLFGGSGLIHLELATKFYLFHRPGHIQHHPSLYDFLGPGLNDTLGSKMQKILQKQLALSQHEAAQRLIPQTILAAKALVKGWLFYRSTERDVSSIDGVSTDHCMGFWWTFSEFQRLAVPFGLILERLDWLAPAQASVDDVMDKNLTMDSLTRHFQGDDRPVMVAIMKRNGDLMQEFCRGFVVSDKWPLQASQLQRTI
jgi:hypothetical protein